MTGFRRVLFRSAHDGRFEVGGAGDEDVDGHDDEREGLEPVLGADAPFVLDHHEANTPGRGRVQLGEALYMLRFNSQMGSI